VVLDFLAATDVGREVPDVEEGDLVSDASEWSSGSVKSGKRRGSRSRSRGGAGRRGGIACSGGAIIVLTHALLHGIGGRGVGDGPHLPLLFPL